MAFDASMLICLARELDGLKESRIEKIYQPSGDEIVIMLHSARERSKILINAGSNYPRIHITSAQLENPQKAPNFCMLLRKHLQAGKLISCTTFGFERAIDIEFEAYDEMGFKSRKHLISEIMGKFSNIILTDSEYKITAVLKPVDFSLSTQRQLLIGMKYELPPKQDKLPTERVSEQDFISAYERASGEMKIERFIISNFTGIAPSTAKGIAYELTGDIDSPLKNVEKATLVRVFFKIIGDIKDGRAKPYMVLNPSGEPQEFSYIPLNYFGRDYRVTELDSFSNLVDEFYSKKGTNERIKQKSGDILRLITNAEARIVKKIEVQTSELKECEAAEEYRQMADLITANLYMIKKGASVCEVVNYYDDNMPMVKIPLDTMISPSQNAQRYYKKYTKLKKAKEELARQIELARGELKYIETVFDALSKAEVESDLNQIRNELYYSGYASRMKNYSVQKLQAPKVLKFKTSGGYTVLCGKNNTQNDYITTKLAEKGDWWFHAKGAPGSHVLMQCAGLDEPPAEDFTEACEIAAYYSKAQGGSVGVDYTLAKHVKKPNGSKPGFVIYHVNWSALVTPNEEKIKKMMQKQ